MKACDDCANHEIVYGLYDPYPCLCSHPDFDACHDTCCESYAKHPEDARKCPYYEEME